jgi:hypothetical protein
MAPTQENQNSDENQNKRQRAGKFLRRIQAE